MSSHRFIVAALTKEVVDLGNILNVVPVLTENFGGFLGRSKEKIQRAVAERALKDKGSKDRKNS